MGHAFWAARCRRGLDNLEGVDQPEWEGILPGTLLDYLREVREHGVPMRSKEQRSRVSSKPHASAVAALRKVLDSVWKDVHQARVLVCWLDQVQGLVGFTHSAPMGAVAKQNPDRSISEEVRPIHDQREPNEQCDKEEHPPALQPTHAQIARQILWWKHRYPGITVLLAKRDISGAFRLLWVDPEDIELLATELPLDPSLWAEEAAPEASQAWEGQRAPAGDAPLLPGPDLRVARKPGGMDGLGLGRHPLFTTLEPPPARA